MDKVDFGTLKREEVLEIGQNYKWINKKEPAKDRKASGCCDYNGFEKHTRPKCPALGIKCTGWSG